MCRIFLDDIPDVLHSLFKHAITAKYKKEWKRLGWPEEEWNDSPKFGRWFLQHEKFQSRLNPEQKQLLESGKTSDWDVTLLAHTLLYSSHFLLADSFCNNRAVRDRNDHCKIQVQANFTQHLHPKKIILCDLGNGLAWMEVTHVIQTDVTLKNPIKSQKFTMYVCRTDWTAVKALSDLRNEEFGHHSSASIDIANLNSVAQRVKAQYKNLQISEQRISDILNGMWMLFIRT